MLIWFFLLFFAVFAQERIVSLSPALTEIVVFEGGKDKLVGVTDFCSLNLKNAKKVGNIVRPDIEEILSLKPDIVIATNLTDEKTLNVLKKHTKLRVFKLRTLKELEIAVKEIAKILHKNPEFQVKRFKSLLETAISSFSCLKGKTVFILVSEKPPVSAGSESYFGEVLKRAGANVEPKGTFSVVLLEDVFSKADIVFFCGKGRKLLKELKKRGKKVVVCSEVFLHPSPYFLKESERLGRKVCRRNSF